MKKYIFLTGMVALMSSCNGDIYDNIKEFVDSETVYPAGYDQTKVGLMSGYDRVEIYLMGDSSRPDTHPYLAKAIKTVVKWGEGPNDFREFTPARSWVNVTGLTVAQFYHFEIYTVDEFGNTSAPVTIGGKPFNKADESTLVIANVMTSANTTQAILVPTQSPESFEMVGGTYILNTDTTAFTDLRIVLEGLSPGVLYPIKFNFNLVPVGVLDTVPITYDVEVATMTAAELDAYINSTVPFPATADGFLGNPYFIYNSAPFIISGGAYDFGAVGVALKRVNTNWNSMNGKESRGYRTSVPTPNGMQNVQGGLDYNPVDDNASIPPLVGIGWMSDGDWWVYTVEVVDPGVYKLDYNRARNGETSSHATLTLDNLDVLGIIEITTNRDWGKFEWNAANVEIALTAGKHKLKWTCASTGGNTHNFGGLRLTYVRPL